MNLRRRSIPFSARFSTPSRSRRFRTFSNSRCVTTNLSTSRHFSNSNVAATHSRLASRTFRALSPRRFHRTFFFLPCFCRRRSHHGGSRANPRIFPRFFSLGRYTLLPHRGNEQVNRGTPAVVASRGAVAAIFLFVASSRGLQQRASFRGYCPLDTCAGNRSRPRAFSRLFPRTFPPTLGRVCGTVFRHRAVSRDYPTKISLDDTKEGTPAGRSRDHDSRAFRENSNSGAIIGSFFGE